MTDFLVAESAIRQLHSRYMDAVWRKDFEAFGDCFTEDSEWRIKGRVLRGRAAAVEYFKPVVALSHRILIKLQPPILEVGNGIAKGRTYFTAHNFMISGPSISPIGVYYEEFVDQGAQWRFSWRLFETHYIGSADLSGELIDHPEYGAPPEMPARDALPKF